MTNLEWALKYSSIGWHVLPIWWIEKGVCACGDKNCIDNKRGKHPLFHCVPNGLKQATNDPEIIKAWWSKFPKANIAVATGKISGISALDVDARHGGFQSLEQFDVPTTVQARSGSGSSHFIMKYNKDVENTQGGKSGIAPGIDTKNDGGYLIVEPSNHYSGGKYEWITDQSPFDFTFADAPNWLLTRTKIKPNKEKKKKDTPEILSGERNSTLTKLAGVMHRKGLSSSAVFAALKEHNKEFCIPPLSDDELRKISDSISNYKRPGNSDIEFDRFFNPKKTIRNSVVFLEQKYGNSIWFNEFSGCEFIGDKPVSDLTVTEISEWLMFEKHIELPDNSIDKAIKILALRTKRNPVADYLSSLVWDGKERVKTIFSNYMNTEDTILQRRAAGMFLVSAVSRIFDPGCKYDHMIILMSKQGTGKQRLLETLAGKWYGSVRFKDRDKETVQKMLGRWFIEVGEMRGMGTKEINDIKDFVTTRIDRERFAYGRKLGEYPRTNIFVGSWNPDHVGLLNDKTGNRRFIPIEIGKIDIEGIKEVRDQLFAESVHMYKDGYRLYLDDDEDAQFITELNNIHKKVEVKEEWANHIVTFMQSSKAFDIPNEVTILDVFCAIFPNKTAYDLDYNSSRRIGSALAQLGCDTLGNKTKLGITAKYFDVSKLRVKNGDFSSKYDVLMAVLMEKTGFSTENINDIINNKMLENVNKSKDWEE